MKTKARVRGFYQVEHFRDGALIDRWNCSNGVVNTALNDILEVYFRSGTAKPSWFIGLINSVGFTQLAETDTIAAHSGWAEYITYDEAARQEWDPGAASLQQLTNSVGRSFSPNVNATLKGFLIASDATKGGSTGILWSTALFDDGDKVVIAGDTLRVTYTILASDEGEVEVAPTGFIPALGGGQWWGTTPRVTFDAGANDFAPHTLTAGNELALMFRIRRTGTISKVGFLVGNIATGTLQLKLEGIDDVDGTQDGVLISAGAEGLVTLTSPGDDNSWITLTLDTPTPVVAGQEIAVVFEHLTGGNHIIRLAVNASVRQSGFPYLVSTASAIIGAMPICALEYDDGLYNEIPGVAPWSDITSPQFNSTDTPDEYALKIIPSRSVKIAGFWIDFRDVVVGDVDFVLYDSDGTTVLATVTHGGQHEPTPGTTMGTRVFMFDAEYTLTAGLTYRLSIKPTTANDCRFGLRDVESAAIAVAAPGGADFGLSTRTDAGAWSNTDLQRPNAGLYVTEVAS